MWLEGEWGDFFLSACILRAKSQKFGKESAIQNIGPFEGEKS